MFVLCVYPFEPMCAVHMHTQQCDYEKRLNVDQLRGILFCAFMFSENRPERVRVTVLQVAAGSTNNGTKNTDKV